MRRARARRAERAVRLLRGELTLWKVGLLISELSERETWTP